MKIRLWCNFIFGTNCKYKYLSVYIDIDRIQKIRTQNGRLPSRKLAINISNIHSGFTRSFRSTVYLNYHALSKIESFERIQYPQWICALISIENDYQLICSYCCPEAICSHSRGLSLEFYGLRNRQQKGLMNFHFSIYFNVVNFSVDQTIRDIIFFLVMLFLSHIDESSFSILLIALLWPFTYSA